MRAQEIRKKLLPLARFFSLVIYESSKRWNGAKSDTKNDCVTTSAMAITNIVREKGMFVARDSTKFHAICKFKHM